ELGHVRIPLDGLLAEGQPVPVCNCGMRGDGESIASLTGIKKNLLPYWLGRYPGHELSRAASVSEAAARVSCWSPKDTAMANASRSPASQTLDTGLKCRLSSIIDCNGAGRSTCAILATEASGTTSAADGGKREASRAATAVFFGSIKGTSSTIRRAAAPVA